MTTQFDALAEKYRRLDEGHYVKRFAIIPTVFEMLDDVQGELILDVGCGYGLVSRMLEDKGAGVVGIDNSPEMIKLAQAEEKRKLRIIDYYNQGAEEEFPNQMPMFDDAIAILVMNYIKTQKDVNSIFRNVHQCLMPGRRFIGFQNHFIEQSFEGGLASSDRTYVRIPSLPETPTIPRFRFERKVGEETFSAELQDWPKAVYEQAAKEAGFRSLTWHNAKPSEEGLRKMPSGYWENFKNPNIFLGFQAIK